MRFASAHDSAGCSAYCPEHGGTYVDDAVPEGVTLGVGERVALTEVDAVGLDVVVAVMVGALESEGVRVAAGVDDELLEPVSVLEVVSAAVPVALREIVPVALLESVAVVLTVPVTVAETLPVAAADRVPLAVAVNDKDAPAVSEGV